jgi:hypothetical protein
MRRRGFSVSVGAVLLLTLITAAPRSDATASTWQDLHESIDNTITNVEARAYLGSLVDVMQADYGAEDWSDYGDSLSFFVDELIRLRVDVGSITLAQEETVYDVASEVTMALATVFPVDAWWTEKVSDVPGWECRSRVPDDCQLQSLKHCKHLREKKGDGTTKNGRCETA